MRVFEVEDRHAIAFARLELPDTAHDAAHADVRLTRAPGAVAVAGCRLDSRKIGQRLRPILFEIGGIAIDRVSAPIESQRVFLSGQLLRVGPRLDIDVGKRVGHVAVPFTVLGTLFEQAPLAAIAIALQPGAMFTGDIHGREQLRPNQAAG